MRKVLLLTTTFIVGCITWASAFNVTFRVDMNEVASAFTTPEVNGNFNGWCGACAPMTDVNADGVWEITIVLGAGTFEYKFAADNWANQETLTPGSPCTLTTGAFTNRLIVVSADVVLPVVCWGTCVGCNEVVPTYDVTFQVNMNEVATAYTTPEINGTFNNWCGACAPMTDNNADGIWEITITLDEGSYQYKFSNDAWAGQETLIQGSPCTITADGFTNRLLSVTGDVVLDPVCWGSCSDCGAVPSYDVTFQVDMNDSGVNFTTIELPGAFNSWCGGCAPMSDANMDGIWELTIELEAGTYEYKYAYDNWTGSEQLQSGSACTVTVGDFTNRVIEVNADMTLPLVCWASCEICNFVEVIQMDLPVDFEGTEIDHGVLGFEGAENSTIVVDPTDDTNTVVKVVKSATAQPWAGTTITNMNEDGFASAIPFDVDNTQLSVRVWSPDAGIVVRLKVEDYMDPTRSCETDAVTTTAGQWETLVFNFANEGAGTAELNFTYYLNKASIFFNYGVPGVDVGEKTYYFDDIEFLPGNGGGGSTFSVLFQVDMNDVVEAFTTPEVNGTFNGWCGGCAPMTDDDLDGVWELAIDLEPGTYEYKFAYDTWTGQETLVPGSTCTITTGEFTNRLLTVTADEELPVVCWGSCTTCDKNEGPYNIVFSVDMNDVTESFTTPEINGTFNNWCGGCAPMSDANSDGVWEITIPLAAGTYEYKFAYDAWAGQETLTQGSSCTVTLDGFTNRLIEVTENATLPVVCWASCEPCVINVEENAAMDIRIYPNPVQNMLQIEFLGAMNGTSTLQITDARGQLVYDETSAAGFIRTLDTSAFADGLYFLRLRTEAGELTKTFVVEK
jgi:hypothetical protein